MSDAKPAFPEEDLERITREGRAIYDRDLKSVLEPQRNGQVVAIHLETGDYQVAPTSSRATRALRKRHPLGYFYSTDIGPAPIDSLTLRMLGAQLLAGQTK